jgi:murein DD-endopeptidase MepM/ murein hydrolase activator NlpD
VIGTVGSSGFEEGGPHLHFEIRVGDDYLGDWLDGDELVRVISRPFD